MTFTLEPVPDHLGKMRQEVLERIAALLESQTRTRLFAASVTELTRSVHAELIEALHDSSQRVGAAQIEPEAGRSIFERLERAAENCARLDHTVEILLSERWRQWERNAQDQREVMLEFNRMASQLAGTLIEKDLLERGSRVLESIVLSHERITQWKGFVQEVLAGFNSFFGFDCFFIAFCDDDGLSLSIYYMNAFTEGVKRKTRSRLEREIRTGLDAWTEARFDIEEFEVVPVRIRETPEMDSIRLIAVPVSDVGASRPAGMLGLAYTSPQGLTPQEDSVIRSILAVMVMVVGSSRTLGRTLAELEYHSTHDPLTKLHNRRYFNEILDEEMGHSARYCRKFSILMLDLDDFKDINDTYGHPCGDGVLKKVAETIRKRIRKGDLASRIGGDEFALILVETDVAGATAFAEQLRSELRQVRFEGEEGKYFHVTASIGIATYPGDAETIEDLMAGVDLGLYDAKQHGKDAVGNLSAVQDRLRHHRNNRGYAETLRSALLEGRIVPYFQSIYDCRSGVPVAYEALARIVEPDGAVLSAGTFIETIERYGLDRDLDRAIIKQALSAAKRRLDEQAAPFRLFINLSAQEIEGRGTLGYAERLCAELGVPPKVIVFEILERDAINDMAHIRQFLTELRGKGFLFALDDFGSGYNSFHYLRELSFDFVKIDGAFVKNIVHSRVDRILVHNLIRLCRELGILTIAEFVENDEVLQALRSMGVDYAQGYHLAEPMPQMC